jgi:hypothetical protein
VLRKRWLRVGAQIPLVAVLLPLDIAEGFVFFFHKKRQRVEGLKR